MIIGLTGSIAMGKSTVAKMFEDMGYPVFDADKAVHRLYQKNGQAALEIANVFPNIMTNGAVNRQALAKKISLDESVLPRIENIVHPMVQNLEKQFRLNNIRSGVKIAVMDIPLLFEANRINDVDVVVVVSATTEQQRIRAMQRPGMTNAKLNLILSRQLPDSEKRAKADYIIDTSTSIKETSEQVKDLVEKLLARNQNCEN